MTPNEKANLVFACLRMQEAIAKEFTCWPGSVRSYCSELMEAADAEIAERERRRENH